MTGAGPSRRSHTKSRTGCRTCKRRHIRCDETLPQCRNCTKHQVRCDYMDESPGESTVPSPRSSREIAVQVFGTIGDDAQTWRQSGVFPFPRLNVRRPPLVDALSDVELRLIFHLCSVCNDLKQAGSSSMTIWTERVPKFLSLASEWPFVLHALCSFSATHLAWKESSSELRGLQAEHGGIALRGLHQAIGTFSHSNADAILAASMLMSWQATDWMSWSSLTSGTYAVLSAMPIWNQDNFFNEFFPQDGLTVSSFRAAPRLPVTEMERMRILNNVTQALQKARQAFTNQEMEIHWLSQLMAYINRLKQASPAQSTELQFEHAYMLRKWAFWVPVSLLEQSAPKRPSMIILAHLYAAIVALQPLFPDLLGLFQTVLVQPALTSLIDLLDSASTQTLYLATPQFTETMQFPRRVAHEQVSLMSQRGLSRQGSGFSTQSSDQQLYSMINVTDLSPAFAPSGLAMIHADADSNLLSVPMDHSGFSYGISTWGKAPSPGFPPQDFGADLLDVASSDVLISQGGFVHTIPIWA